MSNLKSKSFRHLAVASENSSPLPTSPYPWPDEEMMARYGLRYPTLVEKKLFPTHRLVLAVFKVRITKITNSPYLNPKAGIGNIVWAVESYPGSHQIRMLGGDLLHEQYHGLEWERVGEDTPVTTLASARREQARRQWRRRLRHSIRQSLQL